MPHKAGFVAAAAVFITAAAAGGVAAAELVHAGHHPTAQSGLGSLPSWLPKDTTVTDASITGTVARPGLTSQGDTVRAVLPDGGPSVRISVTGPETPGEGLPFQAAADTATWTVHLSHATGDVPIAVSAFSAIDSLGKVYQPALVPGARRPPKFIKPGQSVSFELRAVMRIGEGDMRWAPVDNDLLATWDFVVEND